MDRALLVAPEPPYPLHGGGALRTAAMLHYLAAKYRVDAILFREAGGGDPRNALPAGLVHDAIVLDLPRHSRSAPARILRNLGRARRGVPPLNDRFAGFAPRMSAFARNKRYAVGVIEHFWCAPYQDVLNEFCDSMVLDLHNIESRLHNSRSAIAPAPLRLLHRRFARQCLLLERRWLPRFDLALAASEKDATEARAIASDATVAVYPNTIPFRCRPPVEPLRRIALSGNFSYDPNRAAVAWFTKHVWPGLRERHRDLEWRLIGRNPDAVRDLVGDDPRVSFTGEIDDAGVELARSLVAVVPLFSGSGTRVKIVEAWAAGTPVVTTGLGGEGLPGVDGVHWLMRDDPHAFAEAVSLLLNSPELRDRVGLSGRTLYELELTWDAGWKRLEALGV